MSEMGHLSPEQGCIAYGRSTPNSGRDYHGNLNGPMCWASLPVHPLRNPCNLISQSRGRLTSQRSTNDVTPAQAKHVRSLVQSLNQMKR